MSERAAVHCNYSSVAAVRRCHVSTGSQRGLRACVRPGATILDDIPGNSADDMLSSAAADDI